MKTSTMLTMMSAGFQDVGSNDGFINISNIVPDSNMTGIDWESEDWDTGTEILIWNGTSYVGGMYYWTGEVPKEIAEEIEADLELSEPYNNIWVNADLEPVNFDIPAGTAFWIQDANRTTTSQGEIIISGEVASNSSAKKEVECSNILTMMGNPFPKALDIANLQLVDIPGIDWESEDWDTKTELLIWNGTSYVGGMYYWTGEVPKEIAEEIEADLELSEPYNNIWVNGDLEPVDVVVPEGGAFWIRNPDPKLTSKVIFPNI